MKPSQNFKMVPQVIFGRGCFDQLGKILTARKDDKSSYMVFLVDNIFSEADLMKRLPLGHQDLLIWVHVEHEPTTYYVDELTQVIKDFERHQPTGIIGIGGGSTLDIAKAVSLMITNPGSAADYQGWDLIKNPGIYHVGVPTLSGTGAEVSRTTVLTGPCRKLGINSDYTIFDQLLLDPELTAGVPRDQRFHTGMDCYIHCIESLNGTYLNYFSRSYGQEALVLCREVFLEESDDSSDKLMIASYFGGLSIACSQVGVCHALSYGLSYVLGFRHGVGNCIVFKELEEYYPQGVAEFHQLLDRQQITLPQNVMQDVNEAKINKMTEVALFMEPLWENALGPDWRQKISADKIIELYQRM